MCEGVNVCVLLSIVCVEMCVGVLVCRGDKKKSALHATSGMSDLKCKS